MKLIITVVLIFAAHVVRAQDTSLAISGYVETYYGYDFDRPVDNSRQTCLYNHNRHNEFNLNLGYVRLAYAMSRVRANLAFAAGTYMNANYAAEPGTFKNVFEANLGYKLSSSNNVWLDLGIMPSHIGFESAVGGDNWTLSRSIVAENSPYFESGAKLSYTSEDGRLMLAGLALNGWQRIQRLPGNSLMSWGTQVWFKPSSGLTLNYSTFFGTDSPDSARRFRNYHNIYGIFTLGEKLGLIAGFDLGVQKRAKGVDGSDFWYSPVAIFRYKLMDQWAVALRGEYFLDENGILITPNFNITGISANIDYQAFGNVLFRLEGRGLNKNKALYLAAALSF